MRLIFATYENKWKYDILRYYHYLIKIMSEKHGFTLIDISHYKIGSTINSLNIDKVESVLVIENHDEILINDIFTDFFNLNTSKYIIADDIHKYNTKKSKNYYDLFNGIFVMYREPFIKLYPNIDKTRIYWCPHAFVPDFDINYNINPRDKILLSGACGILYPLRKQLLKLSTTELKGYVTHLKHPGYNQHNYENITTCIGKEYAKLINRHLVSFTDCLIYGYIVSKYFEIPACGSLLLAQNPEGDKLIDLGFIDGINYISCNKDNMTEKIKWIMDTKNRNEVNEIRKAGMNLVKNNHSIYHRIDYILRIMLNKN